MIVEQFTTTAADGVPIVVAHYPVAGSADTVIIAHGLPNPFRPSNAKDTDRGYAGLAEQVASAGHSAAIFNFRGTGESGGHVQVERWPDDLAAVLDALQERTGRRRFVVAGFSAGGNAAIRLAARDERVAVLIALAAPSSFRFLPLDAAHEEFFQAYKDAGLIRPGFEGDAESWIAGFGQADALDAMAGCRAERVVLIHGRADDTVPVSEARLLADAAGPKAETILLDGVGHRLRREPRAVAALMATLAALPRTEKMERSPQKDGGG
ncbi:MAG: alpha/beta fold hydrolase [Deltaproteobacteria bacterium]|nr:alpha/beta fold hydrolase [Deltaproteobacteria bacterium]MCB9478666.1 alpha/beta fold hydrolase [Deltaproteobacteria bacterium]MCB9489804.1 alpha/beta fold hydrolase [Deltaproteobacteria bacterium]